MKLIKQVRVNGYPVELITDEIRLDLEGPGRANLSVISDKALSGIVQVDIGYSGKQVQQYFTGYIEKCTQQNSNQYLLFCRELAAGLNRDLFMSLRNATLEDVAAEIHQQTKLKIITPKAGYAVERVPFFYHMGGGYMAMDSCGKVFQIPEFIWQQQGDGSIYLGSWQDSRWSTRPVELPNKWLTEQGQANQATIPLMPPLRPGIKFNNKFFITSVRVMKEKMVITWSAHLNA